MIETKTGKRREGNNWSFEVMDDLDISEAVECLSKVMEVLADHPNIEPAQLGSASCEGKTPSRQTSRYPAW